MRAAYLDDLRSKFLLENSVLKMEYAEVRVLYLSHKVWTVRVPSPGPHPFFLMASPAFVLVPGASAEALSVRPPVSGALLDIASLLIGAGQLLKPE